jgi:hypothetical protein
MEAEISADKLAKIYIKIRDAKEKEVEEHKGKIAILDEQLEMLSAQMLHICKEQNASSIKTEQGTIIKKISTRYWTNDWDSMHKFIMEHSALGLLEQRIHQTNMRQFLEENPELLPPGTLIDSKYTISVRRS